jgi:hypothetical protein
MQNNQKSVTPSDVPDGYTIGIGPNGQHYIVPQFMVTALDNAFESYRVKSDLKVANFQGEVSSSIAYLYIWETLLAIQSQFGCGLVADSDVVWFGPVLIWIGITRESGPYLFGCGLANSGLY